MRYLIGTGLALWGFAAPVLAQSTGLLAGPVSASGTVSLTNKGISTVPALTLGRPAAIFDMAVRKGALGFEPQLRFGLDGKPWAFLFWGRYRPVRGERFQVTLGGHPSFSFRTTRAITSDGVDRDLIQVRRYVAGDVAPAWTVSDDLSLGAYYLYSHGLDFGAPAHTHMLSARATVSNVDLGRGLALQATPQVYFLRTSGRNGTYLGASLSLDLPHTPVAIGAILNVPIASDVTGGQDFLWNLSLVYVFR